jgi:PKD repeat protein
VVSGALSATHTYQDNGVYTATLTVTSTSGLVASDTLVVSVGNLAPQAQAGPDQTLAATPGGTLVNFSGSFSDPGALDSVSLTWDFGDGQTGSGGSPSHTYAAPGTYTVTLTATDDDGGQSSDTLTVTISAEPAAQTKIYLPLVIK